MKIFKSLGSKFIDRQQTNQSERSLAQLFAVTALSILSSQAQAFNLVQNPGTISAGNTVTINAGEVLSSGDLSIAGKLENFGVSYDAGFHVLNNGVLTNSGFLAWGVGNNSDQVDTGASIINNRTGVMVFGATSDGFLDWQGGTLTNNGIVKIVGGGFNIGDGNIINESSGMFFVDAPTSCSETTTDYTTDIVFNFKNAGYFEVAPQATWCQGVFVTTGAGELVVNGRLGVKEFWLHGQAPVLSGTGTIDISGNAWVEGNSVISPGTKTYYLGTLTINSIETFNLNNRMSMTIDLTAGGRSDKLIVNGPVEIQDNSFTTLNVRIPFSAGTASRIGNSWNIIQATSLTGQFNKVNLPTLPTGLSWNVQYTATGLTLTIVQS